MSKTDKELLELAAKAVGIETNKANDGNQTFCYDRRDGVYKHWDPLESDGDALRLAVDLGFLIEVCNEFRGTIIDCHTNDYSSLREAHGNDKHAATRRAIVRAAAAIGEAME